MATILRSTRSLLALLLLLGSLMAVATPASAAGTGTVHVDVSFRLSPDGDRVAVGLFQPGGSTFVTPGELYSDGRVTFGAVPAGEWVVSVTLGFNSDNKKVVKRQTVTVTEGGTVTLAAQADNRRSCITATIRTHDGSTVPNIAVRSKQPGVFGNNLTYLTANTGPSVDYDTGSCGYADSFVIEVYDSVGPNFIQAVAVDALPGASANLEIVLGDPTPPLVEATGNPDVQAATDLATGQTVLTMWSGSTSGMTLSVDPDCGAANPTSVALQHGGSTFPLSGPVGGRYTVTLTRAQIKTGSIQLLLTCPGEDPKVQALGRIVLYDPSGLITSSVTSEPILDAEVTLHEVPGWTAASAPGPLDPTECESNLSKDPLDPWSQLAPVGDGVIATDAAIEGRTSPAIAMQRTDTDGRYGWDVAAGCWYVTVAADGYEPLTSPVVGVPTEVTDLDLELTPLAGVPAAPGGTAATGGVTSALVTWTAPADGGSAITGYTVVASPGGAEVAVDGSTLVARVDGLVDGTTYTFRVRAMNANGDGPLGAPSAPVRLGFSDVTTGPPPHAFYDEIAWMADRGITGGYPDGTFRPTGVITRQAMAAFLYRYEGSPLGADPVCAVDAFPDVPTSHGFCGEIDWMVDEGYASGYADGGFKPSAAISRQAMAAFLYRLAGSPNGEDPTCTTNAFPDVTTAHAFCGEIDWMVDAGITGGYADGKFKPASAVSRQAMAAFLQRYDGTLVS